MGAVEEFGDICSKHFKPDDFARRLDIQEEKGNSLTPWLKRDEFGITAFPSIHAAVVVGEKQQSASAADRDRRMVRYVFLVSVFFFDMLVSLLSSINFYIFFSVS